MQLCHEPGTGTQGARLPCCTTPTTCIWTAAPGSPGSELLQLPWWGTGRGADAPCQGWHPQAPPACPGLLPLSALILLFMMRFATAQTPAPPAEENAL